MPASHAHLIRLNSRHLGRPMHVWRYGWWGTPVLVVPSASGMAHEWELGGAIEALRPWIDGGAIKLRSYCEIYPGPVWSLQVHLWRQS